MIGQVKTLVLLVFTFNPPRLPPYHSYLAKVYDSVKDETDVMSLVDVFEKSEIAH